jgi:hypothetical protein
MQTIHGRLGHNIGFRNLLSLSLYCAHIIVAYESLLEPPTKKIG